MMIFQALKYFVISTVKLLPCTRIPNTLKIKWLSNLKVLDPKDGRL